MAQKLTVNFKDINGTDAPTRFWCNDVPTAILACQNLTNVSNAQIVSASFSKPINLAPLNLKAAAVQQNVETVHSKAKVHMSGPDAGSVANPRDDVTISIPAPIGTLINGVNPVPPNTLTPLIPLIHSAADVTMDRIDRLYYSKSR